MLELIHCSFSLVVDKPNGNSMPMEILKQEVRNTLLNGAAIFFPDRQTRRSQLFTMMVIMYRSVDSMTELVFIFSKHMTAFSDVLTIRRALCEILKDRHCAQFGFHSLFSCLVTV